MTFSRCKFIKNAGLTLGALTLPSWIYEAQAATVIFVDVNKDNLADVALSTAKKLGASYADIRINRYRLEAVSTRERQVQNVSSGQNFQSEAVWFASKILFRFFFYNLALLIVFISLIN